MKSITANKEKIVIGILILFIIAPVLSSLSYAEFVEHLWPFKVTQKLWYDSNFYSQFDSNKHVQPFGNSASNPALPVNDVQNPYAVIAMTGILAVSVYFVFRNDKGSKKIHPSN